MFKLDSEFHVEKYLDRKFGRGTKVPDLAFFIPVFAVLLRKYFLFKNCPGQEWPGL
jgi:hypothetical protein